MSEEESRDITRLLIEWGEGNQDALDRLMPAVYTELQRIASRYLKHERRSHTLETSALAHEAYLRLIDQKRVQWQNRAHFFAIAAQMMRRILVDHARALQSSKRGGGALKLSLDDVPEVSEERADELVALDDALKALAELDPKKSRLVELRFFGGLTNEQMSEVLGISTPTITRHWRAAKAWLNRYMTDKSMGQESPAGASPGD
jgi:RNA polymerase sigma-70 factor (ECF subfamily)